MSSEGNRTRCMYRSYAFEVFQYLKITLHLAINGMSKKSQYPTFAGRGTVGSFDSSSVTVLLVPGI